MTELEELEIERRAIVAAMDRTDSRAEWEKLRVIESKLKAKIKAVTGVKG